MIQNNLKGISGNRRKNVNFIVQVIMKGLKRKWLSKHAFNRNMQYMILKAECTYRGTNKMLVLRSAQNVCRAMNMKVNQYQMVESPN